MRWIFCKLRKQLDRPKKSIGRKPDNERLFKCLQAYWNDQAKKTKKQDD